MNVSLPPPPSPFGVSPTFVCSLPPLASGLDANARQFYGTAGNLPQMRILQPTLQIPVSVKGDTGESGTAGASGKDGKDGTQPRVVIPLHVNHLQQVGTVPLGRSFILKQVNTTAACRVRLYSTAALRDADIARDTDTPLTVYEQHGCIADFQFDGTLVYPLTWLCSPAAEGGDEAEFGAGDIAYTVDNYGGYSGSGWVGQVTSALAFSGGIEVARGCAVTPGTLIRYTTAGALANTGFTYFFTDAGGAVLQILYVSPVNDFGPVVTNQVLVPVGAVNIVAYSGLGGYFGGTMTDFGHYSSVSSIAVDKAASFVVAPLDLKFTIVKQES